MGRAVGQGMRAHVPRLDWYAVQGRGRVSGDRQGRKDLAGIGSEFRKTP